MITSLDHKKDLLCPFCCGMGTAGNYIVRGFQLRGADKTKPLCWRLYELTEISQMNITKHSFTGKREGYNPVDSAMTEIFSRVI